MLSQIRIDKEVDQLNDHSNNVANIAAQSSSDCPQVRGKGNYGVPRRNMISQIRINKDVDQLNDHSNNMANATQSSDDYDQVQGPRGGNGGLRGGNGGPRRNMIIQGLEPSPHDPSGGVGGERPVPTLRRSERLRLLRFIEEGLFNDVMKFFDEHGQAKNEILDEVNGFTALHVATISGRSRIVEEMVMSMTNDETETRDKVGNTALSLAAYNGITQIVKCLVKKNENLLSIRDERGYIPLVAACSGGYKNMASYLYAKTDFDILLREEGKQASYFLQACMMKNMFDIGWHALHQFQQKKIHESYTFPLDALTQSPSAFFSSNGLTLWERFIYLCVRVEKPSAPTSDWRTDVNEEDNNEKETITVQDQPCKLYSKLLQFIGITKMHDLKLTHAYASAILHFMCERMSTLDEKDLESTVGAIAAKAAFMAVKKGMLDLVREITRTNADVILMTPGDRHRNILMTAIEYRQAEIANFLYGLHTTKTFLKSMDNRGNTVLHVAGEKHPDDRIPGAALQLQREVQWYKEVENIVPQNVKESENKSLKTPYQVFTGKHQVLLEKAEKWMRETSTSYSVVGTLIITTMFAAAFTLPGGNDDKGFPMFKNKASFIYIISDAVSLFAASTSVLMFLGILTSRYKIEDFQKSLPQKLIIGLSTLFISIATMMVTFCSALWLLLERRWWIIIPATLLAIIPVTLFLRLQFPLLRDIYVLTYRSSIFGEKKSWSSKIKAIFTGKKKVP